MTWELIGFLLGFLGVAASTWASVAYDPQLQFRTAWKDPWLASGLVVALAIAGFFGTAMAHLVANLTSTMELWAEVATGLASVVLAISIVPAWRYAQVIKEVRTRQGQVRALETTCETLRGELAQAREDQRREDVRQVRLAWLVVRTCNKISDQRERQKAWAELVEEEKVVDPEWAQRFRPLLEPERGESLRESGDSDIQKQSQRAP